MAYEEEAEKVPSYFVLKVRKGDRHHYVFAEMVASFNYDAARADATQEPGTQPTALLSQSALEEMIQGQKEKSLREGIEIEDGTVITDPGAAGDSWTHAAVRMQSKPGNG